MGDSREAIGVETTLSNLSIEPTQITTSDRPTADSHKSRANQCPHLNVLETSASHYRDLLNELTLEEKISLLSGTSFTSTTGVARLNIPSLKVSDSINGVRGTQSHIEDKGTICFSSTTCLASTWNRPLLHEYGIEVGLQAKLKSVQVVIGPNVNLHRDPRAGRNFETFSEDPLLTGLLASAIVNGLQSTGVGACAKHFVCNESETMRRKYNVSLSTSSRTIRELYMRAFQHMLRNSNPASIMMAYNKIDGEYCSQTPLIHDVLGQSWKYNGCIMSDWYGTRTSVEALIAGLDLEMPGPSVFRGQKLLSAVTDGSLDESYIDSAAHSVLRLLDNTVESHSNEPEQTIICQRTSSMALSVAAEGIVLLKNDQNTLPVDMSTEPSIALIGPGAAVPVVSGGGSACATPQYQKSILDCFEQLATNVKHAHGYASNHCVPVIPIEMIQTCDGTNGVNVEYYNNTTQTPVHTEALRTAQLVMLGHLKPGLDQSNFHFIITTTLTVRSSGTYDIGAQVTGDFCLKVDGSEILSGKAPQITVEDFLFIPKKMERTTTMYLEADKPYVVKLTIQSRESSNDGEPTPHSAKLILQKSFNERHSIAEAVVLAAKSDVSVIIAGRTHEHESEGFDLKDLDLDEVQQRLIKAVSAVSKRTVLVLHHGNPIDLSPIIDDVDAVMAAHFPGQEGAQAITDIVLGRTNPSGRLATTWPMKMDATCVPSFDDFPCTNSSQPEIEYAEGLQLGYRSISAITSSRFPFGHGLSYSDFVVSQLKVSAKPGQQNSSATERTLIAQVNVQNLGPLPGQHVVQLYTEFAQGKGLALEDKEQQPWRPQRELVAFTKTHLAVGESEVVEMSFLERDVVSTWNEQQASWQANPGTYTFVVADDAIEEACCRVQFDIKQSGFWDGL